MIGIGEVFTSILLSLASPTGPSHCRCHTWGPGAVSFDSHFTPSRSTCGDRDDHSLGTESAVHTMASTCYDLQLVCKELDTARSLLAEVLVMCMREGGREGGCQLIIFSLVWLTKPPFYSFASLKSKNKNKKKLICSVCLSLFPKGAHLATRGNIGLVQRGRLH